MNKRVINKKPIPKEITWLGIEIDNRKGTPIKEIFDSVKYERLTQADMKAHPGDIPFIGGSKEPIGTSSRGTLLEDVYVICQTGSAGYVNYFEKISITYGARAFRLKPEYQHYDRIKLLEHLREEFKPLMALGRDRAVVPSITQEIMQNYRIQLPIEQEVVNYE